METLLSFRGRIWGKRVMALCSKSMRVAAHGMWRTAATYGSACLMIVDLSEGSSMRQTKFAAPPLSWVSDL